MLKYLEYPEIDDIKPYFLRPAVEFAAIEKKVYEILDKVRWNGDSAVRHYTELFDKAVLDSIEIPKDRRADAESELTDELKNAIELAAKNIEHFHFEQKEPVRVIETMPGVRCWRKSIPIEKVGLYIPGGTAPLFSTLLMLGIPARVAGCREIVLCTPPRADGTVHPAILFAAKLAGVSRIFRIGGVQAIAAMAFGTETVPKVDKIFGPGNAWVTAAKQLVSARGVAIDLPAGPSELAILADENANPRFVAADLLSQAEHGRDSQVVLLSTSPSLIADTMEELKLQLEALPRKEYATQALENSICARVASLDDGLHLINEYAPEHLILACKDAELLAEKVTNAGSVFLGNYSAESTGDYASGTNHTLPTQGYARAYSGVSLDSFVKKITFQHISREGLQLIGPSVEIMAEAEGLQAHKNAITIRISS